MEISELRHSKPNLKMVRHLRVRAGTELLGKYTVQISHLNEDIDLLG
jgi:hypothetical protein